jgi:glutathione S-transferase
MWTALQPHVTQQFEEWQKAGLAQLDAHCALRRAELNRLIDDFANQYRNAYNQVLAHQQRERQRLEATKAAISQDRVQVSQRRAYLEHQLSDARSLVTAPSA